jgi:hypothetical protein
MEINEQLENVKSHLKKGGTYFDSLVLRDSEIIFNEIIRSGVHVDALQARQIADSAAKQFLNEWIGSEPELAEDLSKVNLSKGSKK